MFSIVQAAGWPIWPLIFCSIVALTLIIERSLSLREKKICPPHVWDSTLELLRAPQLSRSRLEELDTSCAMGRVLAVGIQSFASNPNAAAVREVMQSEGRLAAHGLEKYLPALATIASAAPLLGLLGTVVGMIEIFGSQSSGTGANPAQLAHGISVALYNTAFGLIVAIPALIFWRYFRSKVDTYLLTMENLAERLAQHVERLPR